MRVALSVAILFSSLLALNVSCRPPRSTAGRMTGESAPPATSDLPGTAKGPIEINGREHPEMIPDWAAWDSTFSSLSMVRQHNIRPAIESLHMTEQELALVFREVDAQLARRQENEVASNRIAKDMRARHRPLSEILAAQRVPILRFRTQTLAGSDRLLAALGPGARQSLLAYVERTRRSLTVTIYDSDLQFYRQPR